MACGMVFALAMREVDLSVGGMYAMGVVVGALLIRNGVPSWLAAAAVLALSALLGAANGAVTTYLRLPSFIVTLAASMLLRGVGLALAQGKQITDLPADDPFFTFFGGDLLGVPVAVWVFALAVVVLSLLFTRTRFGVRVRAIGSNPEAAEFSGLPLAGGSGSVVGAATGTLILSVVTAALVFFEIPINWTQLATGGVILIAVASAPLLRRVRARRSRPASHTSPGTARAAG
jgi:ribose transport system permease protein